MNADDVRSVLRRSIDEGGLSDDGGPDETAIARRVRGARRRRVATVAAASVASVALVGVVVWQAGRLVDDPPSPATPTVTHEPSEEPSTAPSTDPSDDVTDEPTGDPGGDPDDWSDAVFPACGDAFAGLPERTSQLVVTEGPDGPTPTGGGPWLTQVRNDGATEISGDVAYAQMVVVDGEGVVVATNDPTSDWFWGAEGSLHLAIAPGDTLPFPVSPTWRCGDSQPLPSGEYEAYVLLSVGEIGVSGPDDLEQAQGGPFPLLVDDDRQPERLPVEPPPGAVEWTTACGDTWSAPEPTTGFALDLEHEIRSPRAASDDIDGAAQVTAGAPVTGVLYNDVVLVRDGQVVTPPPGSDAHVLHALSEGSRVPLGFTSSLVGCDGSTLPAGQYQAVVLTLLAIHDPGSATGAETYVVATSDVVDLVLT
ncbi:MAG TPA: hypothetical protein VKY71_04010 [Actinotalea caeni]|uniref:hypothetical protein n=1 Tax=Actinotalea caeni TaxID=1348467 RepID=UPI002B4B6861|nr:hypothetical protein [Actinotalea caeni]HLV54721.1 hypothetical protein [Actinotalea caeni]